ncbi:MAG: aminotransferase class I/II-fold pyridoxal phosphate-dependent enzyme [Ruminococcus sp.]|nr:aminotransferase class I/II-fold pyridoxal phosphate-dependent enzyme [Ruminococcus sp.]
MNTSICDFVRNYAAENALRLHMPGHKGITLLGCENLDITEIQGADSLYEAQGIIKESELNASLLFGCDTFYSTEGSSQCIRAMLYLVTLYAKETGRKPLIYAGRNAHKTFITACALIDFQIQWLYPRDDESYLSCTVDTQELDEILSSAQEKPAAVYLTSPDYLGNVADIQGISKVCKKHGVLLIVDNAHGAYLRFLESSQHPIDLGADMCCDSAHKTLPVLTGGAYLHISPDAPRLFAERAKSALSLFGSTSPSYLILQSLDMANKYIAKGYTDKLAEFIPLIQKVKASLTEKGYTLVGAEELKITISTKPYGYTGYALADILQKENIVCEFTDPDFLVLMLTPENTQAELARLTQVLCSITAQSPVTTLPPAFHTPEQVMTVREAMFSASETINTTDSIGRILASTSVGCPPAVPLIACGERIDKHTAECFAYYGITACTVIK